MLTVSISCLLVALAQAANDYQVKVWSIATESRCLGKTEGFTFIDPVQCDASCDDNAFPQVCSITFGNAKPDCTRTCK